MDYSLMLKEHKKNKADATISVINVSYEEASRLGIMKTDPDGRIIEFEEKPKIPKSTLASMGIYIFTWEVLREYLVKDNEDINSDNDFGKNIIPSMLNDGKRMWAYQFEGYWRDVGTIEAFWESNMELIQRVPVFNLFDPTWKIYTPNPIKPAHYIGPKGVVKTSIVTEGCMIFGTVRNSVIFPGVFIDENTVIEDSIVMTNCKIGANSYINKSILGESAIIGDDVKIGVGEVIENELKPAIYYSGITVVGESSYVPDGAELGKNVVIDRFVTTDDYCSLNVPSGKSVFKGGVCD
jgi:glucose-1-phosphate adenylyltransferase